LRSGLRSAQNGQALSSAFSCLFTAHLAAKTATGAMPADVVLVLRRCDIGSPALGARRCADKERTGASARTGGPLPSFMARATYWQSRSTSHAWRHWG